MDAYEPRSIALDPIHLAGLAAHLGTTGCEGNPPQVGGSFAGLTLAPTLGTTLGGIRHDGARWARNGEVDSTSPCTSTSCSLGLHRSLLDRFPDRFSDLVPDRVPDTRVPDRSNLSPV